MSIFGDRLRTSREAVGLSQSDLARRVGVKPQTIQAIESGSTQTSRSLAKIARVVNRSPEWLMGEESDGIEPSVSVNYVTVKGIVAAGFLLEDSSQVGDETLVPAAPDPRFARLPQIAFRVVGNSMNRLVRDGEYVICVDYAASPLPLRDGDVVVAERRRPGEVERTVKRVRMVRGRIELWPDSDDPVHQKPLKIDTRDGDNEVQIAGLVVGYYRPV